MSTLVAQTISNGTVSTSSTNVIQGSAKAWVYFQSPSTTVTVVGSFNVSSVTFVSTGNWNINFTTAMANANYALVGSAGGDIGIGDRVLSTYPVTTAYGRVVSGAPASGTVYNASYVCAVVFN
jgi:hypothetical protein